MVKEKEGRKSRTNTLQEAAKERTRSNSITKSSKKSSLNTSTSKPSISKASKNDSESENSASQSDSSDDSDIETNPKKYQKQKLLPVNEKFKYLRRENKNNIYKCRHKDGDKTCKKV